MKVLQPLVSSCRRITKVLWWWRATPLESFKKKGAAVKTWNSSGWWMNACQQYEEAMEILRQFRYLEIQFIHHFECELQGLQSKEIWKCPRSPTGASHFLNLNQNQVMGYGLKSCDLSFPLRRTAGNSTHFCPVHLSKIGKHWILHAKAIISNHRSILNSFHRRQSSWKVNLRDRNHETLSQFPTSHHAVLCHSMSGCPESQARGLGRRSHRCPSNLQKASQLLGRQSCHWFTEEERGERRLRNWGLGHKLMNP